MELRVVGILLQLLGESPFGFLRPAVKAGENPLHRLKRCRPALQALLASLTYLIDKSERGLG